MGLSTKTGGNGRIFSLLDRFLNELKMVNTILAQS